MTTLPTWLLGLLLWGAGMFGVLLMALCASRGQDDKCAECYRRKVDGMTQTGAPDASDIGEEHNVYADAEADRLRTYCGEEAHG